ncbi:MAG: hypothetical protein A2X08_06870 [Bacteroidetes bacterium GWA2_32_17]|nr:MAG: hypothetical protein A2X08_06870 [Bacteroidetes bacterium GWA2_32_17]
MIPVSLTIEGLYSYQKKQTVDFTKLTRAGLFGIFGQVGSGKSSILEAITFALYGETDRLDSRDNRKYNMMNLKSNEMFIEFVFVTGINNNMYMATAKSRRNSKNFDDVKTIERLAYKFENNDWIPIELNILENVIGLSYENFKRTIIIPQGKFQEFIQLGNKDRTQMLKELFNLGKFELYYKVAALETKNNEKTQNIDGQLKQLGEINPEQIEILSKHHSLAKTQIDNLTQELELKQSEESNYNQLKILFDKKGESEKTKAEKLLNKNNIEKLENNIKQYEYCTLYFKNIFEKKEESIKAVNKLQTLLDSDEKIYKSTLKTLSDLTAKFEKIKVEFDNKEITLKEIEELNKVCKIIKLEMDCSEISVRVKKGEKISIENLKKIEKLKEEQEELKEQLKTKKLKIPDIAELSKIKEWHTQNNNLLSTLSEIEKEISLLENEILQILSELKNILKSNENYKVEDIRDYLIKEIEVNKKKLESINDKIYSLNVQVELEQWADELCDGEPCPLCGSEYHPKILNIKNVSKKLENAQENKKLFENKINEIENILNSTNLIFQKFQLKYEQKEKLLKKKSEINSEIEKQKKLYNWEIHKTYQEVETQFELAEKLTVEIEKIEVIIEKNSKEIEKEIKNQEKYKETFDKLNQTLTNNKSIIELLKTQIEILDVTDYLHSDIEQIQTKINSKQTIVKETTDTYNKLNKQIAELQNTCSILKGIINANTLSLNNEKDKLEQANNKVNDKLKNSQYNIDEIKNILLNEIDIEKEKLNVNNFKLAVLEIENRLKSIITEINNRDYIAESHNLLKNEIPKIKNNIQQLNQEFGKINNEINKLNEDVQKIKLLQKERKLLNERYEDIKTLKNLFKGSGFVNFVSTVYLQNLCNNANERFYKLTQQKLSIEINEENSFQVRDFMNDGKVRNIKTLSGGQTFQAALSLALALADNVQKIISSNHSFFFLDEGFGTLDKDSMYIVFDTLKSLQKENRIVGVISHVEDMKEEIESNLQIINNEELGSIIKPSWE